MSPFLRPYFASILVSASVLVLLPLSLSMSLCTCQAASISAYVFVSLPPATIHVYCLCVPASIPAYVFVSLPLCLYPCLIPPLCLCVYVSVIFVPVPCLPYVSGIYTHRGQSWAWGVTTPGFWGGDHWLVVGVVVGGRGLSMKYYYIYIM